MNKSSTYKAYLLRLNRADGQRNWRALLRDAETGDERRFATERDLIRYLLTSLQDEQTQRPPHR